MTLVSRILATVAYVTCFPLARNANYLDEESLSGLAKFLPVAGVIIGGSLAIVSLLLGLAQADKLLSAAILTVLWLLLTNGLHYDGLMDTADGIFSHQSRERMLEIMHDSRVGNFGALAGVCVFVLKFASLASLSAASLPFLLIVIPAWARWGETFAIGAFPYAREVGKGKVWHDTTRYPRDLLLAAIVPLVVVVICCQLGAWQSCVAAGFTIGSALLAAYWLSAKLGGQTGDTYGTVVELSETCALVLSAVSLPLIRFH